MKSIKLSNLDQLVVRCLEKGYRVIAPTKEKDFSLFREIKNSSEADFSGKNPRNPIKEFFFPPNQKLFSFKKNSRGIEYEKTSDEYHEADVLIIGARPCDCASLDSLSKLFNWDLKDHFFNDRLQKTTIITFACDFAEQSCFCTSVGGAPDNESGSDMVFIKSKDSYLVKPVSGKGEKICGFIQGLLKENQGEPQIANIPKKFKLDHIKVNLEKNFESPLFEKYSDKCLSCGICTYLCPNCYCFDIADETQNQHGARYRNYDSCQFESFTLHASNHNPRPDKKSRWRQRIMHKFAYYPDRLGVIGCTGCGRCIQYCPVKMNLIHQLEEISNL